MATVFSNSQSSAGSTNSLIISTVRKRPRSAPPFSTSTLSDKMKFDREVDKGKRKQGPAPFPLSDPLPADATSEDDRRDAEVARQQGEETRFVRGRRAEKHLERMRDKGKDAKVMRETSRQDDERGSKRREEKAVLLSKATIDESIGTPFPLPRPSSSCSVEISPVPTRKRPTLADRNGLGETKKPSKGAAIIPRADSEKVKPKLAIKKRPPTLSRIVDPDIWASIHDSPDPLELPGPSTMVKRPPQRQPFPLAGLGSFDSMPRPLQHSPEQSSLSRYVSRDLSVFGSSPSSKSKEKKRKKGSRRDAEQRQVRRTSSDFKLGDGYSETASEDAEDLTPSAKRRNTLRIVSPDLEEDIAPVTVSRQGEGYAFFDALSQMDDDMKDGMWGSSDVELEIGASSSVFALSSQAKLRAEIGREALMEDDDDAENEDELTKVDRLYLEPYFDTSEVCPYCSGRMPIRQSRHLLALASRLRAIHVPEGDDLHWKHSTEFCSLHEAETTVIPLGIRDGYPETIDFPALQERLIHGWIGEELDGVVKDPRRSPLFGLTVRDITIMGKTRWVSMSHQSSERMVNRMMPGYYGHLGRAILLRHFQNLLKWGFLPTLTVNHGSSSSIFPLSTNDFICHVLVPEAAILLIMEDKGHTTEQVANSPERVAARAEACRARKKSVECGRWRFRADGDEAEAILNKLERQESKTRRLYQRLRGPASPTVLKVEERATRSQPVVVSEDETTESGITGYKSKKSTRKHHRITTPETGTKPP